MSSPLDYFVSQGWTPEQSAGIIGNGYGESGLNPAAVGDGGAAYGIFQWHPDRQAKFQEIMGVPIRGSTAMQQYQFANWELNNTEKRAGNALRRAGSVADATSIFMKKFERPFDSSSLGNRLAAAQKAIQGIDLKRIGAAIATGGASEAVKGLTDAAGITGKSWLEQLKDWIASSHFFQRLGIGFLALIFIAGALYLLGAGKISKIVKG